MKSACPTVLLVVQQSSYPLELVIYSLSLFLCFFDKSLLGRHDLLIKDTTGVPVLSTHADWLNLADIKENHSVLDVCTAKHNQYQFGILPGRKGSVDNSVEYLTLWY